MKRNYKKYYLEQLKRILDDYSSGGARGPREGSRIITQCKAAVKRIVGKNSEYFLRINQILNQFSKFKDSYSEKIAVVIGVVKALYQDIQAGYLKELVEIITEEIFSDYLEMAEYLLEEHLKDASAVIAGSTLEEHLRKIAINNHIDIYKNLSGKEIPKKTSRLNQELYKKEIIKKGEMKQITAWLDIRNNAAHGDYDEYDENQVDIMIKGIRLFISKTSLL